MTLELRNVTKQVSGRTHIKETSLVLEPGHFNVLLGQTGSGKTSLIKLMAGLDAVASGQILVDGEDVTRVSTQKRQISLVHQFFVNYPHMTVFDNIASPLRVAGLSRDEIRRRVDEAADILKLGPLLSRRPHELSGGQQQRTALARAIAKDAKAVLLWRTATCGNSVSPPRSTATRSILQRQKYFPTRQSTSRRSPSRETRLQWARHDGRFLHGMEAFPTGSITSLFGRTMCGQLPL